jgi:hypothetical protein
MWFTTLLRSAKRGLGRRPRTRRSVTRERRSFVPRLEALDDRALLSTLTVLNNFDKGAGSLRDAIVHAHDGDDIDFAPNLAGETITLTSGALVIRSSVDIQGLGAHKLTISGNDTSRVFDISAGLEVKIADLTITHGRTGGYGGGGILNVGSALTLANAVLSYNESSKGDSNGGAIFSRSGASLTVTACTFIGNHAITTNGQLAGGGGIYNDDGCTALVSGSTFIGNRAVGGDGGEVHADSWRYAIGGGEGGAIHNDGYCTIVGSTFIDNQAIGGNGGSGGKGASFYAIGFGLGGAVFNHPFLSAVLVIDDCTFTGNEAIGGSNATGGASGQGNVGHGQGGALANFGVATVTNSTFDHNQARGGDGNRGGVGSLTVGRGAGGALFNSAVFVPATMTVRGSNFTDNQASGGDGNTGGVQQGPGVGGAIATVLGAMTQVADSTFDGNLAIGGAGAVGGTGGDGLGGGIYNDDRSSLEVHGSTITDNQATGGAAGSGSAGSGVGGGLYLAPGGSACLDAFTIAHVFGNHASTNDDDVFGNYTIC